ncbi:hypothetical protein [Paenibacillus sp. YYML68]|nr:hypothetical protein [Paenibacillus sp. YYML68]
MTKKVWEAPEIKDLELAKTEYGSSITPNIDASYVDGDSTYYSFS